MGDFTLGCLLGQYDKAQSFDVDSVALVKTVNSWGTITANATSWYFSTDINSSNQGLELQVYSWGSNRNGVLRYRYDSDNDAYARWFSDIATHNIQSDIWARIDKSGFDNTVRISIDNKPNIPILENSILQNYRYITTTYSGQTSQSPFLDFDTVLATIDSFSLFIDDVLTQVDPIILHPEYSFQEEASFINIKHRTVGGEYRVSPWEKHFAYTIPLRFLSDSHAALINWWWENKFNLLFTLNTSDSESLYVCQITNQQQPIGRRIRPHNNLWEGVIQLESIDRGSLVF